MRLFLLLFTTITIEVVLIAKVGSLIGFFYTFLLIIGTALLGSWLLKKQWRLVIGKMQTLQSEPSQSLVEAFILLICGIFLISPGFLTDIIGFIGLIPPVREFLAKRIQPHIGKITPNQFQPHNQTASYSQKANPTIIEGEFEHEEPKP